MVQPAYKRILIKLSGESLKQNRPGVIDSVACDYVADRIFEIYNLGVQIGVVVGGGNIFRGNMAMQFGFARTPADHVGMLATAINGLILSQVLSKKGCKVRVMSAMNFDGIVEMYNWTHALYSLDEGYVIIFVGGTGNPYFTTDTTAAMRACELDADILFKATKVEGVYNKDPTKHLDAIMHTHLTFNEALAAHVHVMDSPAIALCRESNIPIHVFQLSQKSAWLRAVTEKQGGTVISNGKK